MDGFSLMIVYGIFGSFAVAAALAIFLLGGNLLWVGFKSNFLGPALSVARFLSNKR